MVGDLEHQFLFRVKVIHTGAGSRLRAPVLRLLRECHHVAT